MIIRKIFMFWVFIASFFYDANASFLKGESVNYYQRNHDKFKISFRDEYSDETYTKMIKTSKEGISSSSSKITTSYPDLKFYGTSSLKGEVIVEVNSSGLIYKGKLVSKRKLYDTAFYFGPDDFYKFEDPRGNRPDLVYSYFEFDRYVNDSIIEASYKGEKIYLNLASIKEYNKVPFNLEKGIPEYKVPTGLGERIKVYWIERPRNQIYNEFLKKFEEAKVFLEEVLTCLDKDGPKCLKENGDEENLHSFFDVIYSDTEIYVTKGSNIGDWVYESPSLYEAVKDCLKNGDIIKYIEYSDENLKAGTGNKGFYLQMKSRKDWKQIDGASAGWLFCQIYGKKILVDGKYQQVSKPKLNLNPPPVD
jgi:hypothetical protein